MFRAKNLGQLGTEQEGLAVFVLFAELPSMHNCLISPVHSCTYAHNLPVAYHVLLNMESATLDSFSHSDSAPQTMIWRLAADVSRATPISSCSCHKAV